MIQEINKDITTVLSGIVVHGCNCSGGFGSGVAGAIKKKWPEVEQQFRKTLAPELGDVYCTRISDKLMVCNAYTQQYYGYDGKKYANINAIEKALTDLVDMAKKEGINNIYMPKIGCGLGGLDYDIDLLPVLENLKLHRINLFICTI